MVFASAQRAQAPINRWMAPPKMRSSRISTTAATATTTITVIVLVLMSLLLGHDLFQLALRIFEILADPFEKFLTLPKKETFFAPSFFLGLSL